MTIRFEESRALRRKALQAWLDRPARITVETLNSVYTLTCTDDGQSIGFWRDSPDPAQLGYNPGLYAAPKNQTSLMVAFTDVTTGKGATLILSSTKGVKVWQTDDETQPINMEDLL